MLFAKRKNGIAPKGSFTETDWLFSGVSALDGLGVCQGGGDSFETIMGGIGDYDSSPLSTKTLYVSKFNIYPNLASTGFITIKTVLNTKIGASVFDILGKIIVTETIRNNRLNISELNKGVYLLNISQNERSVSKKLIIE